MHLHREGNQTLIISLVFFTILNLTLWRFGVDQSWLYGIGLTCLIIFGFLVHFFRDPRRVIAVPNVRQVYAPADGKVVVIEDTIESEYFKDERLMISIFMSPLNVHSNHHPVAGRVVYKKYHPGKYLVAWHPKSSTENERTTIVYDTGNEKILVRQIAGAMARRIVNYCSEGDEVNQGGEMGFIKFGSRVDIYLPVGTHYTVKLGQAVLSNVDVIADFGSSTRTIH